MPGGPTGEIGTSEGTLGIHDKGPICPVADGLLTYWQRANVHFQLAVCPQTKGHNGAAD